MSEQNYNAEFIIEFADAHYFVDAFDNSENYRKHLRGSMGSEHEAEDCESLSSLSFDRAVGCWLKEGLSVIRPAIIKSTSNVSVATARSLVERAILDFGREVSIKRERDVAKLIKDTVLLSQTEREAKWAEFRGTLDDTTYEQLDGRMERYVVINANGTEEPPIHAVTGSTKHFDAVDTIRVSGYVEADSTPASVFRLVIPVNWKATITFVAMETQADSSMPPTRQQVVLTNKARNTYTMSYADWTASIAKLPTGKFDYCQITFIEEPSP